jgi:uncharacterized membrane protein
LRIACHTPLHYHAEFHQRSPRSAAVTHTSIQSICGDYGEERGPQQICIFIAPRCALSSRGAIWFVVSVSIGPILTATFCTLKGFWPVLPFAGLEIAAVAAALYCSMRRRHEGETITITRDEVIVETRRGKIQGKSLFSRHWTRVKLRIPLSTLHPSRLILESRGCSCELGRFLTETERCALAARLKELVGNMNESPALEQALKASGLAATR